MKTLAAVLPTNPPAVRTTTSTPAVVVALAPLPPPSLDLGRAIHYALMPHPDIGVSPPPPDLVPEARDRLAAIQARLSPPYADAPAWARWLLPLQPVLRYAPASDDLPGYVMGLAAILGDVPAHVLTGELAVTAGRRFDRWPTPKELGVLIGETLAPLRREVAALTRLLQVADKAREVAARDAENPRATDAERAAMRQRLDDLKRQEEADLAAFRARRQVKPAYLKGAHLAAFRRECGMPPALVAAAEG